MLIFAVFTVISSLILRFTSLNENSGIFLIMGAMSLAGLYLGLVTGRATGKKGLFAGALSALVLICSILIVTVLCFQAEPSMELLKVYYAAPLICGAVGGILGTNSVN